MRHRILTTMLSVLLSAAIAAASFAADTYRWVGMALDVVQVDTITIANTWATNDTIDVTIGQKTLTLTVGSDVTTAQVAESLKAMIAGEADPNTGDAGRNALGNAVAEFREVAATVSGSVVTLTADTPGKPFVVSVTETTAGDGTATEATATACTGSHYADNANNWYNVTDGTYEVPANGGHAEAGVIVFEQGDTDCLYALTALTDVSPATFRIHSSYTGKIGLARINTDDSNYPYPEYRATAFAIGAVADAQEITTNIGKGAGDGSSRVCLDFGDCQYTVTTYKTASRDDSGVPVVLLQGSHALSTVNVRRGDVGVGFYSGDTSHLSVCKIGYMSNSTTDADLWIGSDTDMANAAVTQTGGELTLDATTSGGTIDIYGGTCTILSGTHASIDVSDATLYYMSGGVITAATAGESAIIDFRLDSTARVVTAITLGYGATLYDPHKTVTFTNGIILSTGVSLDGVTIDVGQGRTIDVS